MKVLLNIFIAVFRIHNFEAWQDDINLSVSEGNNINKEKLTSIQKEFFK